MSPPTTSRPRRPGRHGRQKKSGFARKAPDPVPTVFGYHEVWHAFTLVAGVAQLALVAELAG